MHNEKSLAFARLSNFGWKMGFEPTTFGTTIRHSNQLSYIHHLDSFLNRCANVIQIFVSAKHLDTFFYLRYIYIAKRDIPLKKTPERDTSDYF